MNLLINEQLFIVCGASSGFGRSIAEALSAEGAKIIAVARSEEKLYTLSEKFPNQIEIAVCDITQPGSIDVIDKLINGRQLHGIVVNAGGPPAMSALETKLVDWDNAYGSVLRWKIEIMQRFLPAMIDKKYGRIIFIESASVKQPIENLVLSNSFRLAVVGYVKTLSQEISKHGVTLNVMAPGSHNTQAAERIYKKKNELSGISREDAIKQAISQTSVGFIGDPNDFASLATWLLSPHSRYMTGQTISVDGGSIKGTMG